MHVWTTRQVMGAGGGRVRKVMIHIARNFDNPYQMGLYSTSDEIYTVLGKYCSVFVELWYDSSPAPRMDPL
jgi:hypothetical protein